MSLDVRNVTLRYGPTTVLRDCSLAVRQGELVCLVGPSGCGKTSLLNVIAGIVRPDSGSVAVGARTVDALPTRDRRLAFIMDRLGLYPHLDVFENIAYPLRLRKVDPHACAARVAAICDEVGLSGFEKRRPHQLSAGQQQRVAIARALVRDDAALLLADESFSSLDAQLRYELRTSFRRWQRDRGITALFVTHDQGEALALGDRIALMRDGAFEQIGTPSELYDDPQTLFAAKFFGTPRCNLQPAIEHDGALSPFARVLAQDRPDLVNGTADPGALTIGFRPESVTLTTPDSSATIPLWVDWVESAGPDAILHLSGSTHPIAARVRNIPNVAAGSAVGLRVQPKAWMVFNHLTGSRLG